MTALVAAVLAFVAVAPDKRSRPRGRVTGKWRPIRGVTVRVSRLWGARTQRIEDVDTVPQALELTARALRAGASPLTALEAVSVEMPESGLGEVVRRVRGGLSLSDALDRWVGCIAERQTAAALLVLGHSSGASMASSLDRAAGSIRQRRALGDEIRALTAQSRASAAVVALAPAGFAVVIAVADREALSVLLTTTIGLVSLAIGVVLEGLGLWWMRRLCRSVARWA